MDISTSREIPQRFRFLPTDDPETNSAHTLKISVTTLLFITRCLLSTEMVISMGFNLVLMYTFRHGQSFSILLCIIATSNCIAAATLLCKKRPLEKASPIAVYVIWKVLQEVILVPVLFIFTALMAEGFADNVTSLTMTRYILAIVWIYALFSLFSIVMLGQFASFPAMQRVNRKRHAARTLWKTKIRKRRSSLASVSTVTQPLELSIESEHITAEASTADNREKI